jgi:hypothetical protein
MQHTAPTTNPVEPALLLEMEERSAMTLLRLIAAVGIAVTVLGLALRLAGSVA